MIYPVTGRPDVVMTLTNGGTGVMEGLAEEEDRPIRGVVMRVDGMMTVMMKRMRKRKVNMKKSS